LAKLHVFGVNWKAKWSVWNALQNANSISKSETEAEWTIEDVDNARSAELHNWPDDGRIRFENVALRYQPNLPLVLNNLYFLIKKSEKLALWVALEQVKKCFDNCNKNFH
jgi:ABC-type multidrug transport system fused ATPase/permease subunit